MGEAADDAIDWAMRADDVYDDYDDYGEVDLDMENSFYWSEWRKDNAILAAHIKSGGVSRAAVRLGAMLRRVLDPWDGWEPL